MERRKCFLQVIYGQDLMPWSSATEMPPGKRDRGVLKPVWPSAFWLPICFRGTLAHELN